MHDLSSFCSRLDWYRDRLAARGFELDVAAFQDLDRRRRQYVTENETLNAQRNAASAEIGKLRKDGADTSERQRAVREMAERSALLEQQVTALDGEFRDLLARIPNIPHESVPVGT